MPELIEKLLKKPVMIRSAKKAASLFAYKKLDDIGVSEKNKCAGLRRILVRMQGASARRLSENSNFFQNQGLRKKLPQVYG